MLKVMIVDDEKIVRDGISFILDKHFADQLEIAASAKSGREAIEKYSICHPDIILMDIHMPGINGIEAIEAIQDVDKRVKFIIISAYEQFEYAKQAVSLGVDDYILKPINRQKLVDVLTSVIGKIQREITNKQKELEIQEKLDKVLPVLEYGYIYSILMNNSFEKENIDYHSLLSIHKEYGYIMVIDFGEGDSPLELENKIGAGVKNNMQYQKIRHTIKYKVGSIVGPLMVNRIIVLVYEDMPEVEYPQRVKAVELAQSIEKQLRKITDSAVYIGIGTCYRHHRLNLSYNEAVSAISKMTDEHVLHIKDAKNNIDKERQYSFTKIKSDEDYLLTKIEEGNINEVEKKLETFFTKLGRDYEDSMDIVRKICSEFMVLVNASAFRNGVYSQDDSIMVDLDTLRGMSSFFNMKSWCSRYILDITKWIRKEKENKVSAVIGEAMNYIKENHDQDIRLKDVAEIVSISPQYFSKIFKDELGVNFIDYLTTVRMDEAKRMLRERDLSIKEICYKIGYKDPNYFSRLFKKVEGISPTEFQ